MVITEIPISLTDRWQLCSTARNSYFGVKLHTKALFFWGGGAHRITHNATKWILYTAFDIKKGWVFTLTWVLAANFTPAKFFQPVQHTVQSATKLGHIVTILNELAPHFHSV